MMISKLDMMWLCCGLGRFEERGGEREDEMRYGEARLEAG